MTTLVLGVGVSGLAAARLAGSLGHDVIFYDERDDASLPDDLSGQPLATGLWASDVLDGVDLIITSPGFPPTSPALQDAERKEIDVATEVGFALDRVDVPYIAVTGTNGKTTVTEMATAMLTASGIDAISIGNIGTPASEIVGVEHDVFVVELSSFQLHWWTPQPIAAAVVNIAPDHLDWHGGFDNYAADKAKVCSAMDVDGVVAFDADDPTASEVVAHTDATVVPCSGRRLPKGGNGVERGALMVNGEAFRSSDTDSTHRLNTVIAATIATRAGANRAGITTTMDSFVPGNHRRRVVAVIDGVTWVNDSKATNPHATLAATGAFPNVRLLAGGQNKALDLTPIGSAPGVLHVYAFGESGPQIASAATRPTTVHSSMADAMATAAADASPGDTVLLSPGCTSFDEFTSYAERGRVFEDAVRAMGGGDV